MSGFLRCLKADFIKTKRTSIRLAHLWIPMCVAGIFLAYFLFCPWSEEEKIEVYYQVLGCAFPFLIGIFCVIVAEQEQAAGGFFRILSMTWRARFIYSKLFLLLLLGAGAAGLASFLFGLGYELVMHRYAVGYGFYLQAALLLVGGSVPLYILHLFLAFRFNKGVSIGLGMTESLLAALSLTGLLGGSWIYVPPVWAARMTTSLVEVWILGKAVGRELGEAVINCVFVSTVGFVLLGIWYRSWEGGSGSE